MSSWTARARIALALLLLALGFAPAAFAASSDFRFYLDLDDDQTTGCALTPALAPDFTKAEEILTVRIDIAAVHSVSSVTRMHCNPGTGLFEAATAPAAAIGQGLGPGGTDVIETSLPLTGSGAGHRVRIGYDSIFNDTGAKDQLVTLDGTASGAHILLQITPDVPTLDQWGLLLLALLLTGSGFLLIRRRGRKGVAALLLVVMGLGAGIAWAALAVDGNPNDWNSFVGAVTAVDVQPPDAPVNADIVQGLAGIQLGTLFLRLDVSLATNLPPVANSDAATVTEDSGATAINVLANDTDPEGDPFTIASVTQPANGTVVITGGGTGLTYAPNANYCNNPPGTALDTFTYTLTPGTSSATVTVTVTCVDDPPVAVNDAATVAEDSGASAIDVLANDTDVDGGPKSVASVTQPANGSVAITGGGTGVSYTPNANYCNNPPGTAPDTFTYTLTPGSSTATVSVTVSCVDDPPVAVADAATVAEDSGASAIDVLANDTDIDGGPKSVASVTQPANGSVVITGGGTGLTYAPNANYCNNPPGTTLDTFTYTLAPGGSTATVTMTVTCVDDPPVAVADAATVVEDSGANAIDVLANDTDIDGGPKSVASVTQPANGAVVITGGGTGVTYAPNANYCNNPPGTTLDTFTYTLAPGGSSATVTVTVTCVDDAPVAVDDTATVVEDSAANAIDVLANDTDVDGGPKSVASVTQPANGTVAITGGGTGVDYTPNANYCATNVTTVAQYRLGENDAAAVAGNTGNNPTTALLGPNLPRIGSPAYTATTPPAITSSLAMHFNGTSDAYAAASVASAAVDNFGIEAWVRSAGSVAGNAIIAYNGSTTASGWGLYRNGASYGFLYGGVTSGAFAPVNPGVWTHLAVVRQSGTTTFYVNGLAMASAAGAPNAPAVASSGGTMIGGDLAGGQFFDGEIDEVRVFTFTAGQFSAADLDLSGSPTRTSPDTFTYTLTPGSSTATVAVTVTCVDDPPTAVADAATVAEDSGATAIPVLANDTDPDGGPRSIASVTQPANGAVVITGGGTGLTYAPSANYCNTPPGTTLDTFTYTLAPGGSTATVTMTVTCVDDPPVAVADAATVLEDSGASAIDVLANDTDIDGGPKSVASVTQPANGTVVITGGGTGLTYAPSANYCNTPPGTTLDTFTYTLTPGSSTATVTVTVTCVNDAPSFVKGPDQSVNDNAGAVTVNPWATAISPGPANESGQTVTFQVVGNTNAAIFAAGPAVSPTGVLTFTPAIVPAGTSTATITIQLKDNGGTANGGVDTSPTQTFTIAITHVNIPPQVIASPKETFDTIGNTSFEFKAAQTLSPGVFVAGNLVANFTDPDGPSPISVKSIVGCADVTAPFGDSPACATANGGTVLVQSNGEFAFTPKPGDAAASDSFQYVVWDGQDVAPARTVTLNRVGRVWYVKNNSAAGGLGRSNDPFDTLAEAETASSANDFIFVYFGTGTSTGQTAGIALKGGQHLIGEHAGLTFPITTGTFNGTAAPTSVSLVPAAPGNRPLVDHAGAGNNAVSATNVVPAEIVGLSLSGGANAIDLTTGVALPVPAALSIRSNVLRATGAEGIDISLNAGTSGTLALDVQTNSWTAASAGNGFDARTVGGALQLNFSNNTSITSSATGVFIDGSGGGSITVTGFANNTVSQATVGTGISVTSAKFDAVPGSVAYDTVSGGTTVVGVSGNGVGGAGVVLTGVTGDLAFTDLDVFADGGAGLRITGTGAVNVGAGTGTRVTVGAGVATIEAIGGPAVDVTSSTIDLQLASLKSTNSATTGTSLDTAFGTFSAGSGSTITNATGTDFNVNAGNAAVTYNGTISDATGRLVSVTSTTGGTKSFTGTISDTGAGTGTGIFLNANTGATISFSNTLTLSTGASDAFTATGGGTVTATDANSTVVTTAGTALNVANTTIGATGLKFKSVSAGTAASGPASGIILNNTGASGGLTVNGGTIQKTSGDGVSLTSTLSPSFNAVTIKNTTGSGVRGTQVTNFSFTNGTVDTSGSAAGDSNIAFDTSAVGTESNVSGVVTITGNSLTNAFYHGVDLQNFNGSLTNVNISSNTITSSTLAAASNGSGIRLIANGSATTVSNVTKATISNNIISNFPSGSAIRVQGGNANAAGPSGTLGVPGNAASIISITGNRVAGASAAVKMGLEGILATVSGKGQGNFDVSGNGTVANPIANVTGTAISVNALGAATVTATVDSNVISPNNTFAANGVAAGVNNVFGVTDAPDLTVTINNNSISAVDGNGILAVARNSNGTMRAKIQNNTVAAPLTGIRPGIRVDSGTAAGNTTVCLNMSGNTSAGSGGSQGLGLRKQGTVPATNTFGVNGMAATSTPGVEAFIDSQNPAGGGTLLISATSGFTNCSLP